MTVDAKIWQVDADRRAADRRRQQEAEAARVKARLAEWDVKRAQYLRRQQLEELAADPVIKKADDFLLAADVERHVGIAEQLAAAGRKVPVQLLRSIDRDLSFLKGEEEEAGGLGYRVEKR